MTNDQTITKDIPLANLGRLEALIETKINRKNRRIGAAPLVVERGEIIEGALVNDPHTTNLVRWPDRIHITITGIPAHIEGWTLVGVIEPMLAGGGAEATGNMLYAAPGQTMNESYRDWDGECGHCNTKRNRKIAYVIKETETSNELVVGKQCLTNYLPSTTAEALIRMAGLHQTLAGILDDEFEFDSDGWTRSRTDRGNICGSLVRVLAETYPIIRGWGWVSKTVAQEQERQSTASHVDYRMFVLPCKDSSKQDEYWAAPNNIEATEGDEEFAKQARDWAATHSGSDNEYMRNLAVLAGADTVTWRSFGLAVSLISAYMRHLERADELKREQESTLNEWYANEGDKIEVENVRVTKVHHLESDWGSSMLLMMKTEAGHILKTFYSGSKEEILGLQIGDTLTIKATVKECDEYKDWKQTGLTRMRASDIARAAETTTTEAA